MKLDKTGLSSSQYTPTSGEALPEERLKWSVRVQDNAGNWSDWTNSTYGYQYFTVQLPKVTSVRWEDSAGNLLSGPVNEGTVAYLAVYGTGFSTSQVFSADIIEGGVYSNGEQVSNLSVSYYSSGKWRTSWTTFWLKDAYDIISGNYDPEYYFRLDTYGNTSADLRVRDATPPGAPSFDSGNSTHQPNVWSSSNDPDIWWNEPNDGSGIAGYSVLINNSSTGTPDQTVDTTSRHYSITDTADTSSLWVHVLAQDNNGNWATSVGHFGPFKIDATKPTLPSSPLIQPVGDTTVYTATPLLDWKDGSDNLSGIAQYEVWVGSDVLGVVKLDKTGLSSSQYTPTSGEALPEERLKWSVRVQDNAGNWSDWTNSTYGYQYFTVQLPKVTSVRWEDSAGNLLSGTILSASTVYLAADAVGLQSSYTFTADVFEADVLGDQPVPSGQNIVLAYDSSLGEWRGVWTTEWEADIGGYNPEYKFVLDTWGNASGTIDVRKSKAWHAIGSASNLVATASANSVGVTLDTPDMHLGAILDELTFNWDIGLIDYGSGTIPTLYIQFYGPDGFSVSKQLTLDSTTTDYNITFGHETFGDTALASAGEWGLRVLNIGPGGSVNVDNLEVLASYHSTLSPASLVPRYDGAGSGNAVVMVHGWNPDDLNGDFGDEGHYSDGWTTLDAELMEFITTNSLPWDMFAYDWTANAATGAISTSVINNSLASRDAATAEGHRLAQDIASQLGTVETLQIIAHSAGNWVAREALVELRQLFPSALLQLVSLDPFVPSGLPSDLGNLALLSFEELSRPTLSIDWLDNYYVVDEYLLGTDQFGWTSGDFTGWDINRQLDAASNFATLYDDSTMNTHGGPIAWYAATVDDYNSDQSLTSGLLENGDWLGFGSSLLYNFFSANQSPTDITLSSASVPENQPSGITVGTFSTTDPDSGNTFTYSLVSGTGSTDNTSFTISGSTLQTAASFDYEAKHSYSIRIRSTDQGGLYTEKAFTIGITNVNEQPTDISLSNANVSENQPAGTTVGTLSTTDPDAGNTFTYALVSGTGSTDNTSFTISGNTLKTASSFDYEGKNSYSIRVRSTDQGGLSTEKAFTIGVADANLAPTDIGLSASTLAENQPVGTTVGTLTTTDPEAPAAPFIYTLVAGAGDTDNGLFAISGNTLKTAANLDYESKSAYNIRVRSADQGGLYTEKAFTISVTNVNETPTDISLSSSSIAENQPSGTTVGTLGTTDPDAGNTFTYNLVTGTGSTDNASFTISGNTLKTAASFDFEAKNAYSIRVRSTDQGLLSTEKAFTISVTNANESPTLALIPNPAAILEDAPAQTVNLTGISAGSGESQSLQVTATSSNPGLIPNPTVNYTSPSATGSLSYTPVGNQSGTATITVTVRDAGLDGTLGNTDDGTFQRTFTVTVSPVNDPPTLDTIANPAAINEDASLQTVNLTGISAGGGESQQLQVTASSNNTAMVPNPTVSYASPSGTGSLSYTPVGKPSRRKVAKALVANHPTRWLKASPSLRRPCQDGHGNAIPGLGSRTLRRRQLETGVEKVDGVCARCRVIALSPSAHRDERAATYADLAGWIG